MVFLIITLSFIVSAGIFTAATIKAPKEIAKIKQRVESEKILADAHLEVPNWKWYDDLCQRLDQITTNKELDAFDWSAFYFQS